MSMTLFEIFITIIFGIACTVIGTLVYRVLDNTVQALKTLSNDHKQTKEELGKQLSEHDREIRKHGLDLLHSKEISQRTELEFKTLLTQNNEKFDQVIHLFSQSLKTSHR